MIPNLQKKLPKENTEEDTSESLVHERVTSDDIARVVSRMTGIPVRVSVLIWQPMQHNDVTISLESHAW